MPLNRLAERGIGVAIGIDEAGINDDRDMLQEMRLVLNLHRKPGIDTTIPTPCHLLRMATEDSAMTTPFGAEIGVLEPGRAADLTLMRWEQIAAPYLDPEVPVVSAILHRAKTSCVDTVIVGGEPIYRDGRFTRVDREAILEELAASLSGPRTSVEENSVARSAGMSTITSKLSIAAIWAKGGSRRAIKKFGGCGIWL